MTAAGDGGSHEGGKTERNDERGEAEWVCEPEETQLRVIKGKRDSSSSWRTHTHTHRRMDGKNSAHV